MKTATVRQVRHDFGSVMDWVAEGESVEISKRGKVIALITPPPRLKKAPVKKRPDFLARFRRNYGENWETRVGPKNSVVRDREERPY